MSFIRDLITDMKNITKQPTEEVEETRYEISKTAIIRMRILKEQIKFFKIKESNINQETLTNFMHTVNQEALEYERFIEDYDRYLHSGYNENSKIIKDMLKKKEKWQAKLRIIYNQFVEVVNMYDTKYNFQADRVKNAFDLENKKWNEIIGAPTRTYLASNPLHGRNQ